MCNNKRDEDKYGNLKSINAMDSIYYKTYEDDYTKRKILKISNGVKK